MKVVFLRYYAVYPVYQLDKDQNHYLPMNISLHYKLFGAFLAAILAVVIYMSLVMQWSFNRGFLHYINTIEHEHLERLAPIIEEYYRDKKSWQPLKEEPAEFIRFVIDSLPDTAPRDPFLVKLVRGHASMMSLPSGSLPADVRQPFFRRLFLLDGDESVIFGYDPEPFSTDSVNIFYQNRVVGTLGVHFAKNLSDAHQLVFARRQKGALILVAVAGFLLAAGLSLPFSHRLTRPIRKLAAGTRDLASGRYETRIDVKTSDELGQLSKDFNGLAEILEKNRLTRSRWFADISHELRTPLAILRGKIEALQDGVYAPDAETFASLHREVMHLGMLVDDIYQLSLSDKGAMSYKPRVVKPCWALEQALGMLEEEVAAKELKLVTSLTVPEDSVLFGDNERLQQLFTNILSNSVRYTDPGGRVEVRAVMEDDLFIYEIADSAPGVSPEHFDKLFDRLYRVDDSRSRELGGAGLGLAICHNIVTAHGGSIEAGPSSLGGLLIRVTLPVSEVI